MQPPAFLIGAIAALVALCQSGRADQSIGADEPVAILDGYSSSLTKQNVGLKDDEPIKAFLLQLNNLARGSSLKTRFVPRNEIADGVRTKLKPGRNDVSVAVAEFLKEKGFQYALAADFLVHRDNDIVLQLYTVSVNRP